MMALVLTACLVAACGSPSDGDGPIELITGHQLADDTSFQVGLERFADLVDERTGGEVLVRVHPNAEIGTEMDMFQGMRTGTVDAAVVAPNSVAEFVPELQLLSMPFLVSTREQRDAVIAGDAAARMEELVAERMGVEIVDYFGGGIRNLFFTQPVGDADDLRDRMLRIQPSQVLNDAFAALGLRPTLVDYGELYSALEQGVVDGADNESLFIVAETFYVPAPYLVLTRHEVTIRPLVFSQHTLDGLPDDLREIVLDAARDASAHAREYEAAEDDEAFAELEGELGAEIIELDLEELTAQVEPVWTRYAEQWGMSDMLEQIVAERVPPEDVADDIEDR